jgi:hypothetical protein
MILPFPGQEGCMKVRAKTLNVTWELVRGMLTSGGHCNVYEVIQDAIPEDSQLIGVNFDGDYIVAVITHESFPEVSMDEIPILTPVCRRIAYGKVDGA